MTKSMTTIFKIFNIIIYKWIVQYHIYVINKCHLLVIIY